MQILRRVLVMILLVCCFGCSQELPMAPGLELSEERSPFLVDAASSALEWYSQQFPGQEVELSCYKRASEIPSQDRELNPRIDLYVSVFGDWAEPEDAEAWALLKGHMGETLVHIFTVDIQGQVILVRRIVS